MHGHHHHGVRGLIVIVDIRHQRNFLQEGRQGGFLSVFLLKLQKVGGKLVNIFYSSLRLFFFSAQRFYVAGFLQNQLIQLMERHAFIVVGVN